MEKLEMVNLNENKIDFIESEYFRNLVELKYLK